MLPINIQKKILEYITCSEIELNKMIFEINDKNDKCKICHIYKSVIKCQEKCTCNYSCVSNMCLECIKYT